MSGGRWRRLVMLRRNYLFVVDREQWIAIAAPLPRDDRYRVSFPARLREIDASAFPGGEREFALLAAREAQGDLCGVIWSDGRIVHRSLVQREGALAVEGDRYAMWLGIGDYYIHDCQTAPDHDGRGLHPRMLRTIVAALFVDGATRRVLISCRDRNTASVHGILEAGFRHRRTLYTLGVADGRVGLTIPVAGRGLPPVAR